MARVREDAEHSQAEARRWAKAEADRLRVEARQRIREDIERGWAWHRGQMLAFAGPGRSNTNPPMGGIAR